MKANSRKLTVITVLALFTVILTDCTNDNNDPVIFQDQGVIGPEGGIVQTIDGASVEIPAGALTR